MILTILLYMNTLYANPGKSIYLSRCTACHNVDPSKPGKVGPDIAGSSLELITLKTQKREYPLGYIPKRKTKMMPRIPLTQNQLKDLHSYISSFKGKK